MYGMLFCSDYFEDDKYVVEDKHTNKHTLSFLYIEDR
jgi:hypothetical protein